MGEFKLSLVNLILFLLIFCGNLTAQNDQLLLGYLNKDQFLESPHDVWFKENYTSYEIDKQTLIDADIHLDDLTFLVFLGSWCGDTKRELPRFLKIIEYLSFSEGNIRLTGLDRKKQAPVYTENIWNIEFVPTFIVLKNGIEIGRITEQPLVSLEADLKQIVGLKYIYKTDQKVLRNFRNADSAPYFGQCDQFEDQEGTFKCSEENISTFFRAQMKRPDSAISFQGKASVNFVIDVDGKVKDIRVKHADSKMTEAEAFRLVNKMNYSVSGWKPAVKDGHSIPVKYKLIINFNAQS